LRELGVRERQIRTHTGLIEATMKNFLCLLAILILPLATRSQQTPPPPAPDISLSVSGGSSNLYQGWPFILHVTILNTEGDTAGGTGALVISPTTGVWTDTVSFTIVNSTGTTVSWPLKLAGTASDPVLTLAPTDYVQASWQMAAADVSALPAGDYTITANIQVSKSNGWNGSVQSIPLSITVGPEPTLTADQQAEKVFQGAEFAVNNNDLNTAITITQQLRLDQPDNATAGAVAASILNQAGYESLAFLEASDALSTFYRVNPTPVEAPSNFLPSYQQLLTSMATPDDSVLPTSTIATPVSLTFNPNPQSVGLSASVTSSVDVEGGTVAFTITGITGSATSQAVAGGSATATFTVPGGTQAGSYAIQAAYSGTPGFTSSSDASATLKILPATPIITWNNPADITQGTALGATQLNATANVPGTFAYTPAAGTVLPQGASQALSVRFTPTDATDYNGAAASVTINVKAPALIALTITASNATQVYGQATPPLNNVSYSGFTGGDTPASLGGSLACVTTAKSSSPVGTYPINCSGLSSSKYAIAFVPGALNISSAALKVTANNATRPFGQANPAFTGSFQGFVNGDGPSALSGTLTCSSPATSTSSVSGSPYAINCSGVSSNNYKITFVAGSLSITKATPAITWSNPASITQGTALGAQQLNASASVAGNFVYTPAAGTVLPTGSGQTLSVTFTPSDAADYNTASASVTINVQAGVTKVAVPNVVGETQAAASSAITGAGLAVGNVTTASSSTVAAGSVISETPAAGTQVATASSVNLVVSSGPAAVPKVVSFAVLFGGQSYSVTGSPRNRLPWQITGVRVVFTEPIAGGSAASLSGATVTGMTGLGTNTLTWTINPISAGIAAIQLSGSGATALKDAAGNALGSGAGYVQSLKILWGDFNDDGSVSAADMVSVNNAKAAPYNIFADMNGDGVVDSADVQIVRTRAGTTQP
jgi:MBG domain (YGX type)/PASTA domain/Bacterial Ig-like domain (group 3)/Dockerin type I domain